MIPRLLFASAVVLGAACTGPKTIDDLCNKSCDCSGCDDAQKEQCLNDSGQVVLTSEDNGCREAMNTLVDCYVSQATCEGGTLMAHDECRAEQDAVASCVCTGLLGSPAHLGQCQQ